MSLLLHTHTHTQILLAHFLNRLRQEAFTHTHTHTCTAGLNPCTLHQWACTNTHMHWLSFHAHHIYELYPRALLAYFHAHKLTHIKALLAFSSELIHIHTYPCRGKAYGQMTVLPSIALLVGKSWACTKVAYMQYTTDAYIHTCNLFMYEYR